VIDRTTLRMERTFDAPVEEVFDAWTSEEVMRRWWHTWTSDGDSKRQLIEIEFEERDGATTVRFTHRGLWDEESVESHRGGWGTAFDNLERVLAGAARGGAA
jgi:uncharacterized protein YndB with AHSA1/START domain